MKIPYLLYLCRTFEKLLPVLKKFVEGFQRNIFADFGHYVFWRIFRQDQNGRDTEQEEARQDARQG